VAAEVKDAYAIAIVREGADDERTIRLKEPVDGQLLQIARATSVMQRAGGNGAAMMNAVARCMDVLLALIESDADRFWMDEGLTQGTLEVDDMKPLMDALGQVINADEDMPAPRAAKRTQRAVNGRR
jgi:hypothetical protein